MDRGRFLDVNGVELDLNGWILINVNLRVGTIVAALPFFWRALAAQLAEPDRKFQAGLW